MCYECGKRLETLDFIYCADCEVAINERLDVLRARLRERTGRSGQDNEKASAAHTDLF